jgi:hypothetical protein
MLAKKGNASYFTPLWLKIVSDLRGIICGVNVIRALRRTLRSHT